MNKNFLFEKSLYICFAVYFIITAIFLYLFIKLILNTDYYLLFSPLIIAIIAALIIFNKTYKKYFKDEITLPTKCKTAKFAEPEIAENCNVESADYSTKKPAYKYLISGNIFALITFTILFSFICGCILNFTNCPTDYNEEFLIHKMHNEILMEILDNDIDKKQEMQNLIYDEWIRIDDDKYGLIEYFMKEDDAKNTIEELINRGWNKNIEYYISSKDKFDIRIRCDTYRVDYFGDKHKIKITYPSIGTISEDKPKSIFLDSRFIVRILIFIACCLLLIPITTFIIRKVFQAKDLIHKYLY